MFLVNKSTGAAQLQTTALLVFLFCNLHFTGFG